MEDGKWKMENGKWKMENSTLSEPTDFSYCYRPLAGKPCGPWIPQFSLLVRRNVFQGDYEAFPMDHPKNTAGDKSMDSRCHF